jgi:hypothetical protein
MKLMTQTRRPTEADLRVVKRIEIRGFPYLRISLAALATCLGAQTDQKLK